MGRIGLGSSELEHLLTSVKDGAGKVAIIKRHEWTIYLEKYDGGLFGHVDIHKPWTPRRAENLEADFKAIMEAHGGPIFATHLSGDAKHLKFLLKFGFQHYKTTDIAYKGKTIEVFVRLQESH